MDRRPDGVRWHPSAPGEPRVAFRAPHPLVRPMLARAYVGYEEADRVPSGAWLHPGQPTVTVIINLAEPFGGLPPAFLSGLDPGYSVVPRVAGIRCVDLKLHPIGGYALLGRPMDELAGRSVELSELLGPEAERLTARLRAAPDWTARFALLDAFLAARADRHAAAPEVVHAFDLLRGTGGRLPIGTVADRVGWSRKHLITRFRQQVGVPPKAMAQLLRFDALRRALRTDPPRWAELAAAHGYYDQPHLNRDFARFAGTTPARFLAAASDDGALRAAEHEVNSVQDRPPRPA